MTPTRTLKKPKTSNAPPLSRTHPRRKLNRPVMTPERQLSFHRPLTVWVTDVIRAAIAHPILDSKHTGRNTGCKFRSQPSTLFVIEFEERSSFTLPKSPLTACVHHVILMCPKPQMVRVTTGRNVTRMANEHTRRNWPLSKHIGVPVRPSHTIASMNIPVPIMDPLLPNPTAILTLIHQTPKPFLCHGANLYKF